jgi:hypothetical protein
MDNKKLFAEMRSLLNEQNAGKGLPSLPDTFPDWCVRSIFEKRNNLPQTELPAEVRKKMKRLSELNIIGHSETRQQKSARLMAEIAADGDAELILKAQASLLLL